jgi:hypothetical protein
MRYSEEVMALIEMNGSEDGSFLPESKERTARSRQHLQRKGTFQADLKKRTDTNVKKSEFLENIKCRHNGRLNYHYF